MERTQFTFYESFYKALARIRKGADRATAYDVIVRFALYGEEPDTETLPDAVAIAFEVIKPNLAASRKKSEAGRKGGEAKTKQTASKHEANGKQKKASRKQEQVQVQEQEKEQVQVQDKEQMLYSPSTPDGVEPPLSSGGAFERFWAAYPKKVGKQAALKAFQRVKGVPFQTMIDAVEAQKGTEQWQKDNGRFIPNPATWLNQGRWEDEPTQAQSREAEPFDAGDTDWVWAELEAQKVGAGHG